MYPIMTLASTFLSREQVNLGQKDHVDDSVFFGPAQNTRPPPCAFPTFAEVDSPPLPVTNGSSHTEDARSNYGSVAMSSSTEIVLENAVVGGERTPPPIPPSTGSFSRFVMVFHCFLSFVICNIDRINLSVAIIPMAETFSWSESTKGLVQSVFFLGYMTTQIAGGILADRRGGRPVLAAGVLAWSLCTILTPPAAHIGLPVLLVARVILGVGEGVAMPAMNSIIAGWIPVAERARSLSFVYSGMYAGSILGLIAAPSIIELAGWPAVFYVFGGVGVAWVVMFWFTTTPARRHAGMHNENDYEMVRVEPEVSAKLVQERTSNDGHCEPIMNPDSGENSFSAVEEENDASSAASQWQNPTPSVREMLGRKCVWAIIVAHFCCTWGYFVLLTWLPSYLYSRFNLNVRESALLSAAPWVAMFVFANVGGGIADGLIKRNWSVTRTRKLMQSIGFIGPAVFLGVLCTAENAASAMVYVSTALALASFSQSGVYANHQDIGPQVAGTLLGISNTFASLPGVIGVYITGVVLDATENNWNVVFAMAIIFYVTGFVIYNLFATSERQW